VTLFDMEPTAKVTKTVGPMPGDTVQDSLFGDAPVVLVRKHEAKAPVEVADTTAVLFATDEREWDGQTAATDIFGGMA
jgi:hypothetical protein